MSNGKPPVIVNGQLQMPKLSFRQRTSAALLGVKGSLLRSQSKEKAGKEENPVARLKLLLVRPPGVPSLHIRTEFILSCRSSRSSRFIY
jgi:hypothetical protein